MSKAKIVKRKGKLKGLKSGDTKTLQTFFNRMVGLEDPDPNMVWPKYVSIYEHITEICTNFSSLATLAKKYKEHEQYAPQLLHYAERVINQTSDRVTEKEGFVSAKYVALKESELVKGVMVTASALKPIAPHLMTKYEDLDHSFFSRVTTYTFCPFKMAKIDLKYFWVNEGQAAPGLRQQLHKILSTIFEAGVSIYKLITSPDGDTDEAVEMILKAIESMRSRIPRCDKAFDRMAASSQLLKKNYSSYHKDYIQSGDPSNIVLSLASDVADENSSDPQVVYQIRKIIKYYRKQIQQSGAGGGKRAATISALVKQFDTIDKFSGIDKKEDDSDDEEGEVEGVAEQKSEMEAPSPPKPLRDIDELMRQIEDPNVLSVKK